MPGFINAHHHIYSVLHAVYPCQDQHQLILVKFLEGLWFYLDNKLTAPDVKASALLT